MRRDTFDDRPRFQLRTAPHDSVRNYKGWTEPLGEATVRFRTSDFFGLDPYRPILTGKSRLIFLQPGYREDVVRFNRVEGIYTGIPVTYIPGDKLPQHLRARERRRVLVDRRRQVRRRRGLGQRHDPRSSSWAAGTSR